MKRVIALLLAAALLVSGLGSLAQAAEGNVVDVTFGTRWIYDAENDIFDNGTVIGHEEWETDIQNTPDTTEETVANVKLKLATEFTFDRVGAEEDLITDPPPPPYEWLFGDVPEGSGHHAFVGTNIPGTFPVSFEPGFDATLWLSETHFLQADGQEQTQTLVISVTPRQAEMQMLSISVGLGEDDFVKPVHITPIIGNMHISPDGVWLNIGIDEPVVDQVYVYTVTIEVTPKVPEIKFRPQVHITCLEWLGQGTGNGDSVSSIVPDVGTWEWSATESYTWQWQKQHRLLVNWYGHSEQLGNQVGVGFETHYGYHTMGNEGPSEPTVERAWISSDIHNQGDGTGAAIVGPSPNGGPTLALSPSYPVTDFQMDYWRPDSDYIWDLPAIEEHQGFGVGAGLDEATAVPFVLGFSVSRSATGTTFPFTGGTQVLTLTVNPTEEMDRLEINGQAQVNEMDIATISDVTTIQSPEGEINIDYGEYGFNIGVNMPQLGAVYEWEITIEIAPLPPEYPSVDVEYMPYISVRNVHTIASGVDYGSSLSGTSLELNEATGLGEWTYEATDDFAWSWEQRVSREAHLLGYAQVLYQAKDVATEGHFHLRSSEGLHLDEGGVVLDGSNYIMGNLFTFTHPSTPSWAEITSWSYVNEVKPSGHIIISGSFTIKVYPQEGFEFGNTDGTISVSFTAQSYAVAHPLCEECDPSHYNFQGPFKITGGTGFYDGISGSGTIGGTFHDHSWTEEPDELKKWFDFVMIGKARFPGN